MKLWKSLEAQEIQGFFALGRADRKDMALDSGNVILAQAGKIHHRDTESQSHREKLFRKTQKIDRQR
jgi:hypothetical protein